MALPPGRKIGALALAAAVSFAVHSFSLPLRGLDFVPLYAKLSSGDAAQVVDKLRNESVPYRLTGGGRTVMVPSRLVHELRLKMSQEGLPKNEEEGLEILDRSPLGTSDFTQKVAYQRALQGELSRTIGALDNVLSARVHLVFPEESPFLDSPEGARASVVLTLRPGAGLDKRQVSGVVHLVAGAVKGMRPEHVSVLDNDGRLLAGGREEDGVYNRGNEFFELQREAERYLEEKATGLLEGLLGPKKSLVRVRVDMDDRVVREQTEVYDPNGPVRSEQGTSVPNAGPSFVKNYEVGRTVKEIVASPGAVRKLYVSVAVDGKTSPDPADPSKTIHTPRTPEEMEVIAQLIRQAVGFSEDREDQFEIKNVVFETDHQDSLRRDAERLEAVLEKEKTRALVTGAIGRVGSALGILAALFIFARFLKTGGGEPAPVPEPARAAAETPAGPAPTSLPAPEAPPALPAPVDLQANLVQAARKNPAGMARLMQRQYLSRAS